MRELSEAVREENEGGKAGWLECFSTRSMMWKRTLNGCMVQALQQLNGQNFYYYYGPVFFEAAGTSLSSYSIQAVLGGISLAMVLPAMWTIEHVGRRKSLLIGSLAQAVCALIAGLVGHFYTDVDGVSASKRQLGGNVLIAFAVFHVSFYTLFWGPTPWVLLGETFPLRVRPKCIALAAATNWLWNFLLSYFLPLIAADIGPLILLVFCGCLIFAFFYVFFMIPETRSISLEEVDELYRTKVKPWKSTSWVPSTHHAALDAIVGEGRRKSQATFGGNQDIEMGKKKSEQHLENTSMPN
ncbi:uncharacterized protein IL334_005080 [Kwoniella shivajii]|uniref:Major facilitator superfamily (MFS) profile domain-containing protein n=1 Tax=Kwoniella shivajii TaxID=564305 RepID=A0ABZ1D3Y2_9TREE|nr:hypothetical protein IL334_005080 [Kwoniella shivajii]